MRLQKHLVDGRGDTRAILDAPATRENHEIGKRMLGKLPTQASQDIMRIMTNAHSSRKGHTEAVKMPDPLAVGPPSNIILQNLEHRRVGMKPNDRRRPDHAHEFESRIIARRTNPLGRRTGVGPAELAPTVDIHRRKIAQAEQNFLPSAAAVGLGTELNTCFHKAAEKRAQQAERKRVIAVAPAVTDFSRSIIINDISTVLEPQVTFPKGGHFQKKWIHAPDIVRVPRVPDAHQHVDRRKDSIAFLAEKHAVALTRNTVALRHK